MRTKLMIVLALAAAAVTASVAMAAVFTAVGVTPTTADFSAESASSVRARTCTGADNKAFTVTTGRYTGAATFAVSELSGKLTISARTTFSTTDGYGYVEGTFRVKDDGSRLTGRFWGTLSNGNRLVGLLTANSRGNHAKVLGNLSADFVPTTGFTNGKIGDGSSASSLALIAGPICKGKPKPEPRRRFASVEGKVTSVDGGSITIAWRKGLPTATCVRDDASPSIDTTEFAVGTKVEMKCEYLNDKWVVRVLKKHR